MGRKKGEAEGQEQPPDTAHAIARQGLPVQPLSRPTSPREAVDAASFLPANRWRRFGIRAGLRVAAISDWLGQRLDEEREAATAFNFAPVALGIGIAAYYAAPAEPVIWLPPVSAAIAAVLAWRRQRHDALHLAVMAIALVLAGLSVAQWRTHAAAGPVIAGQVKAGVTGIVLHVDRNSHGKPRYTIRPVAIEDFRTEQLPRKLRLSAAAGHRVLQPGESISGLAQLQGFSGPAYPGGYDFAFFNWLDGLGGTGFFLGSPNAVTGAQTVEMSGIAEQVAVAIATLRARISDRLRAGLPGEHGDIAAALITGDRSGLDETTQETLRRSGLAHILAISGLHMALVTLTVMGAVRFLLALSPGLAMAYPVRKWAAAAGFGAATLYLLISGAGVATQRAWVMIAIMLAAAMLDRRALTMRNVAIAAIIILVLAPQSLLHPGFQMSFAAVAALIAAYQVWYRWRRQRFADGGGQWLRKSSLAMQLPSYVAGIAFTSLVAGVATGLFAAYHFHRIAPLGLIANLAAMPIVSLLVIPLALIAMLLMPYGFEQWALAGFGFAVAKVLAISDWVNGFPVAGNTGLMPLPALLFAVAGLVLLTLLRSRLRLAGLACFAAMFAAWPAQQPPDLIVSQDGRAVAAANGQGGLELFYPRRNRFIRDIWLRAWPKHAAKEPAMVENCSRDHCIANLPSGIRVEVVYDPDLLPQACRSADILLAPRLRWVNCRSAQRPDLIIKRTDLERSGTHAIHLARHSGALAGGGAGHAAGETGGHDIRTALDQRRRPWNMARRAALDADDARWQARFPGRRNAPNAGSGKDRPTTSVPDETAEPGPAGKALDQ